MGLLASVAYDPSTAVTNKATTAALATTALDTTNLRTPSFTCPASGIVQVRAGVVTHGATTFPQILLGVLNASGGAVLGRQVPAGRPIGSLATSRHPREVAFLVTGLTGGNSYQFDLAYGVELAVAATNIKYGGPNNTTTDDAWGAAYLEVWDPISLIVGKHYDPAAQATKSLASLLAMTAFDTTNLRFTNFTAPPSGRVYWRIRVALEGSTTLPNVMLGILESSTVKQRVVGTFVEGGTSATTTQHVLEGSGVINGLTPGNTYTYDAAYGVEIVSAAGTLRYGGPNNTTASDAAGGISFELWKA